MDYRILLQEENDAVRERYELSMERIRSMNTEEMQLPYGCYFKKVSAFIRRIERLAKRVEETGLSREAGLDGALLTWRSCGRRIMPCTRIFCLRITGRASPIRITRWRFWGTATASFYPFFIRKSGLTSYMPLKCGL